LEDRVEVDLELGRHRELVAELDGLVRDHPLRERVWAQLMLAMYRSGRQADALLAYQRARSVLVEELGIDPGAELRRLHAAVLAQDPRLGPPAPTGAHPARELPDALQPTGPPFVGRVVELAWLGAAWTRAARGEGGTVFVAGGRGIGKTRLAAEFARQVHDQGGWVLYGRVAATSQDPLEPFAQALASTGTDSAVLVVLDDLHLSGAAALETLAELAADIGTRRLLVLGVYRDDAGGTPELANLIQEQDRTGPRLRRLGPLALDEVAQVLALYGSEQAARTAADEVRKRTGGVPVLVHQAAGTWAQNRTTYQLEETARQAGTTRSTLRAVQSKLADDVVDLQELREHTQQVARLAAGHGSADEPAERPASTVCPYKGLARFEPADAGFFFGRERLVAGLVSQVVGAGLVGVVGPSGSGKSSLVRAGLLPALAAGVLPGSERWRQVIVRPGDHPKLAASAGAERLLLVIAGGVAAPPRPHPDLVLLPPGGWGAWRGRPAGRTRLAATRPR
jgi:hypothetical protein